MVILGHKLKTIEQPSTKCGESLFTKVCIGVDFRGVLVRYGRGVCKHD